MGAAISLPLIPITSLASCCGSGYLFSIVYFDRGHIPIFNIDKNYICVHFVTQLVIFMVIALSPFIVHKLEKASFGFINNKCGPDGSECISFTSVYRINFALGIFHLILAGLLVNVKSTSNPRAVIQNGCWKMKIFAWLS